MKRLILPTALALALLAPVTSARADSNAYDFCRTGMSLDFCGSVLTTATVNTGGGTDLSLAVINEPVGWSGTEFRSIGGDDALVTAAPINGDQCSGTFDRLYKCDRTAVIISFSAAALTYAIVSSGSPTSSANAANEVNAVIVNPEPATIALVATGLLGLGGPLSRWRRRRHS
ncbi:MAG: hypothetical protein H7Z74_00440 [Anaerolineae bacterium]|nr:hypothetical protein [Gemmatimonadaceae bacterium]